MIELFSLTVKQAFPFAVLLMLLFSLMLKSSKLQKLFTNSIRNRDSHVEPTPNIGGIGIFLIYIIFCFLYVEVPIKETILVIYFFVLGIIDDFLELSGVRKLCAFLLPIIAYINSLNFESTLAIPWIGDVTWSYIPHFVFAVSLLFSAINGSNTIDGIDLLCGSLACITFCGLGIIAYKNNLELEFRICTITLILLIPFIAYNSPPARLFLGDAGSLFLGTLIGVMCLRIWLQTSEQSPFYLMMILGVPFLDMITVSISRIRFGLRPWNADRNHIHHLLLNRFNNGIALGCIVLVHTLFVLSALIIATKFQSSKNAFYAVYFIFFLCCVVKHFQFVQLLNKK